MSHKGYFIDWNGQVRSTDDPGHGYCCEVDSVARRVTVISKRGATMHEATLYRSLAAVEQAGVQTELVPGSYPWALRELGRPRSTRSSAGTHRTPFWLHQLRDRCTSGAKSVYALLRPEVLAQAARFSQGGKDGLLDDLAQLVGTRHELESHWGASAAYAGAEPVSPRPPLKNASGDATRH